MYQEQFKKWNIPKYIKKEVKEAWLASGQQDSPTYRNVPRRLRRFLHQESRQADKANEQTDKTPQSNSDGDLERSLESSGSEVARDRSVGINFGEGADDSTDSIDWARLFDTTPQVSSVGGSWEHVPTSQSPNVRTQDEILNFLNSDAPWASPSPHDPLPTRVFTARPQPPLSHDSTKCNLEWVLKCTQTLIASDSVTFQFLGFEGRTTALAPPSAVDSFWSDVQNCIYLYKLRDYRRVRPLFDQLYVASSELLGELTPTFLRKLFTTFSPLNCRISPCLREKLLEVILRLAQERWGKSHAVTEIVKQLYLDNQSRWVTEKALFCLQKTVRDQPRWKRHTSPTVEFEIETSMIALLRKDRDFDAAATKGRDLLSLSENHFLPESAEVREATEALAHVYMDMWRLDGARELCIKRVGPYKKEGGTIIYRFRDSRTMWALEDLAEIERKSRQPEKGVPWLVMAADLGIDLGKSPATVLHVVDKIVDALGSCGRHDEGRLWQQVFARRMNVQELHADIFQPKTLKAGVCG